MRLVCFSLLLGLTLPSVWSQEWAQETVTLQIGKHPIQAEIADTPQSRKHGLSQRTTLCPNCGMLFVFAQPDRYHFWMKDTPLPLSIAFIAADGAILNIDEMQPNTSHTHSAQGNALYALEMNGGWFARNGIQAGDVIHGLVQASPH